MSDNKNDTKREKKTKKVQERENCDGNYFRSNL